MYGINVKMKSIIYAQSYTSIKLHLNTKHKYNELSCIKLHYIYLYY